MFFFYNKKGELLGMIPTMVPTKKKKKKNKILSLKYLFNKH